MTQDRLLSMSSGKTISELIPLALSLGPALEVSGYPKPGNVHRLRDQPDKRFEDFLASSHAMLIAMIKAFDDGLHLRGGMGRHVFSAIKLANTLTDGRNTCLGTATLLIPIAYTAGVLSKEGDLPECDDLVTETTRVLMDHSTVDDAIWFYRAVREANPRYVRDTRSPIEGLLPDIWSPSFAEELRTGNIRLWDVLKKSSLWDLVSRECVSGYPESLWVSRTLSKLREKGWDWNVAVVYTYLGLLAKREDSLVFRKNGAEAARLIRDMASKALADDWEKGVPASVWSMDRYLQEKGWNPGATADIIATGISLYYYEKVVKSGSS
ncbi:MAG: hypothetical protein DRN15_05220 [Thermoprotei archaeon]|nr:MAG: hypothetical protein DRN15_05220 [Thermoprotei archaeon]